MIRSNKFNDESVFRRLRLALMFIINTLSHCRASGELLKNDDIKHLAKLLAQCPEACRWYLEQFINDKSTKENDTLMTGANTIVVIVVIAAAVVVVVICLVVMIVIHQVKTVMILKMLAKQLFKYRYNNNRVVLLCCGQYQRSCIDNNFQQQHNWATLFQREWYI